MTNPQEMALRATSVADYLKSHEGASLADTARALNYSYNDTNTGYHVAIRLNLIEKRELHRGRPGNSPARLEKITKVVELRRQGKSLRAVGADMGISRERARQLLGYAVKQGIMGDKERSDLKHNCIKKESWAYFFELADQIKIINRETYHALAEKHWPSGKYPVGRAGAVEQKCLEKLVQNADPTDPDRFTKEDAALMTWLIHKIKQWPISLSELKKMADEYITTDITLPDLRVKYGIARGAHINPSSPALQYLRIAEKLNMVSREDCDKKGQKTKSETWKKIAASNRKYPAHIITTAIAACERGIPYSDVAKVFGMHKPSLRNLFYKNRKKQAESSEC